MLESLPPSSKSGAVCSNARVERRLRPFLRPFEMKVKRHMRDLGHEQFGPHARRLVKRERMAAGIRRLPFLGRFRKVVGQKASVRFIGGTHAILKSSCGHDGLAAECAQDQRTVAPNANYDLLFAATVPLVQEYATQIWEDRINPGTLVRAHKAWLQRRSSKPTWHGAHGLLGAVIMSLRRIDWSLEKGVALRCDTDELINMLQTPPRRVAAVVERGITRWQMRDAARSLAFDPSEAPDTWLRHVSYMLYSPKGLGQLAKVNGRPHMSKSDDCAELPNRPVVLPMWLCARHVCSHCFAPRARTDSFPSAGCLGF